MNFSIEPFEGPRSVLLPLYAQADDSPAQIRSYLGLGDVLVARRATKIIGHVQLTSDGAGWEIRSIAVAEEERRQGVGSALITAALKAAFSSGAARVVVGAAAADIDNLRFYQRLGFRMDRVERDAFTSARGYTDLTIDGIPLRDRIWLSTDGDTCKTHGPPHRPVE